MMGNYHVRFDGGFREKVSIQTTRPFTYPTMVVEDEVGGQPSLQLTHCVILVEIDVLVLDDAPLAFAEDVVKSAAALVYAEGPTNETNSFPNCFFF